VGEFDVPVLSYDTGTDIPEWIEAPEGGGGGGVDDLNEAYEGGQSITADEGAIAITGGNDANNVLEISKSPPVSRIGALIDLEGGANLAAPLIAMEHNGERGDMVYTARTADPTPTTTGEVWWNAIEGAFKVYDGAFTRRIKREEKVFAGYLGVDPDATSTTNRDQFHEALQEAVDNDIHEVEWPAGDIYIAQQTTDLRNGIDFYGFGGSADRWMVISGQGRGVSRVTMDTDYVTAWRGLYRVARGTKYMMFRRHTLNGLWVAQAGAEQIHGIEFNAPGNGLGYISSDPDGTTATVTLNTPGETANFTAGLSYNFYANADVDVGDPPVATPSPIGDAIGPYTLLSIGVGTLTFTGNISATVGTGYHLGLAGMGVEHFRVIDMGIHGMRGDGIRFQGEMINQVLHVDVTSCDLTGNKRAGVTCQRNSGHITFTGNLIEAGSDSAIDMETSIARNALSPFSYKFIGNTIQRGSIANTASRIWSMTGLSEENPCRDVVLIGNTVKDGALQIFNCADVQLIGENVTGRDDADGTTDTLEIKASNNVRVLGGTFTRPAGAAAGSVIAITTDSEVCDGVKVIGADVFQHTDATILDISSAKNVTIGDVDVYYEGAGTSTITAIHARSVIDSNVMENITVRDTRIHGDHGGGSVLNGVKIQSNNDEVGRTKVHGMGGQGLDYGLNLGGGVSSAGFSSQTVRYGNNWTCELADELIDDDTPGLVSTYKQGPFELTIDHASTSASVMSKIFRVPDGCRLELTGAYYLNPTGLVEDATNAFAIEILRRVVTVVVESTAAGVETLTTTPNHDFVDGEGPACILSTDTVPPNAVETTDYWLIEVDTDTIALASSEENALAETPRINLTGNGVGTHYVGFRVGRRSTHTGTNPTGYPAGTTIAPDEWTNLTMSLYPDHRVYEGGESIYLFIDEKGTATLPAGKIQLTGRYL